MKNKFVTNVAHYENKNGEKLIWPFGPPIFQTHIHDRFKEELLTEGRKLTKKDDDWSFQLAGNLKYGRSYHYKDDMVEKAEKYLLQYIKRFTDTYVEQLGHNQRALNRIQELYSIRKGPKEWEEGKLILDSLWVNFSKKHDFNPIHIHTGSISFVIFLQVPPEIFEVQADSNAQKAGELHFQYGETNSPFTGTEYPIRPYEGLMLMFPATLQHHVPSYWVDAERISVSGNFSLVSK